MGSSSADYLPSAEPNEVFIRTDKAVYYPGELSFSVLTKLSLSVHI